MADCEHCKYASWDYDDAYGARVWFIEGCKREDDGLECAMKEWEDDYD